MQARLLSDSDVEEASRRRLLTLIKLIYFLSGFSASSFGRFATLFYLSAPRSFDASQIGIIEAVQPIISAVGNQLSGPLADCLQRKKLVWNVSRIITTSCIMLLLVPTIGDSFEPVVVVMGVTALFSIGGGVLDAYTLDLLGRERSGEYGKYRLYLAISWGVGNAIMGVVAQYNFDYNFFMFGGLSALCIVLQWVVLPARTSSEMAMVERRRRATAAAATAAVAGGGSQGHSAGSEYGWAAVATPRHSAGSECGLAGVAASRRREGSLRSAVCRARFVAYLLEAAYIGFAFTLTDKFLFVFISRELGAPPVLCGVAVSVTVVFEVPSERPLPPRSRHAPAAFVLLSRCFRVREPAY